MPRNSGSGLIEIETDNGTAIIDPNKPNFKVNGSGGASTSASNNNVFFEAGQGTGDTEDFTNLGFSYDNATGTFTIHDRQGNNLNTSNGSVRLWQSGANVGLNKVYTINQNFRFIDSNGSSQLINNLFGKFTGDDWFEDMPMYVYAVSNTTNTEIWFAISRQPWLKQTTAEQFLGSASTATADQETSFYFLQKFDGTNWVSPVLSEYELMPCKAIGNFLVKGTATDDWTVQPLISSTTMGTLATSREYVLPTGVYGASAGNYMFTNSGTPPTFVNQAYTYSLSENGFWWGNFEFSDITNGSNSSVTFLPIPFRYTGTLGDYLGNGAFSDGDASFTLTTIHFRGQDTQANFVRMGSVNNSITRLNMTNNVWVTEETAFVSGFLRSQVHVSNPLSP